MLKKTLLITVLIFSFLFGTVALTQKYEMLPTVAHAQDEDLSSGGFMFPLDVIIHEDIEGGSRQNWIRKGINYIFERVIGVMAGVIGGLAVLVMSIGGFMILISAGNENLYQKGTSYVKYSLIGLAITLGAYIIVTAVQILIKSIYG
ncbi:hypothetical protein KJ742_06960 [Patescibacteria group bacterium]|nr:hypothetical protein [Patescibacteria group bacterium]MBU1683652.1 hypothetical protein [Patescibacteria group bacterium]MBU1935312.1 hypothetical protein [Patescibacteria group bacterium]